MKLKVPKDLEARLNYLEMVASVNRNEDIIKKRLKKERPDLVYIKGRIYNGKVYKPRISFVLEDRGRVNMGYDRYIAGLALGRWLKNYEVVYHKDGSPFNNVESNFLIEYSTLERCSIKSLKLRDAGVK
jgi:hypothetical protein